MLAVTSVGANNAKLSVNCNMEMKTVKFCVTAYIDGFRINKEYAEFGDAVDEYNRLSVIVNERRKGADSDARKD